MFSMFEYFTGVIIFTGMLTGMFLRTVAHRAAGEAPSIVIGPALDRGLFGVFT